ncbi:MAG: cytochrome oxidase [Deltaproteobacteria bacterium]|nr:cytochrome oxidase [Deltaproteobacteria bacterium]
MEVIYLQVFVSFGLVVGSLLLFAFSTRQRDVDHVDRLALFPLEDELTAKDPSAPTIDDADAAAFGDKES